MCDLVFLLMDSMAVVDASKNLTLMVVCVSSAPQNSQQSKFALEFGETFSSLAIEQNNHMQGRRKIAIALVTHTQERVTLCLRGAMYFNFLFR